MEVVGGRGGGGGEVSWCFVLLKGRVSFPVRVISG